MLVPMDSSKDRKARIPEHGHVSFGTTVGNVIVLSFKFRVLEPAPSHILRVPETLDLNGGP